MQADEPNRIAAALTALHGIDDLETYGRVSAVRGLLIEIAGPVAAMSLGGRIDIEIDRGSVPCEVIGFAGDRALAMPFGSLQGVRRGCPALVREEAGGVRPTSAWAGRVIDALGRPIDGKGPLPAGPVLYPFRNDPPPAHARQRVAGPLDLGVRAINTFLTTCEGQRMGIFSGSGVGKSVLLSMLARYTAADVAVIGLVGERGREVQEFLQDDLGEEGLARSVVIVATSDEPALMRRNAAYLTLTLAEYFRDQGASVLCMIDFGDAVRHGAARHRPRGRRAADRQGLHADRVQRVAAAPRACRSRHGAGDHHGDLHGARRGRRPQRAGRRRRARASSTGTS